MAPARCCARLPHRRRLEGHHACTDAGNEAGLSGREEDEVFLTEAIEIADGVDQVALGLRQRLQGDGPAAAGQERLHDVQIDVGDAGLPRVPAQIVYRLVGEVEQQQSAGGERLGEAGGGAWTASDCVWPFADLRAAALADHLLRDERLGDEGEAFGRHGQGRQVELLADGLEFAAVEEAQLDDLLQVEQERLGRLSLGRLQDSSGKAEVVVMAGFSSRSIWSLISAVRCCEGLVFARQQRFGAFLLVSPLFAASSTSSLARFSSSHWCINSR